ncbi:hypothetical protein [Lacihabitans sp. CS3-21]|uniref:hypothetical protein n=1 Tax=Lacihabitans sp. CS3-21 TaxID=2487332 RepID=UPI0020CDEF12|nr:hypothetical protein [Lacihabitans sp. CS3-21]MCP9745163.1 hypothetical protein [Lacihabitans sp. CS3-21]
MKKLLLILVLFTALTSCEEESDPSVKEVACRIQSLKIESVGDIQYVFDASDFLKEIIFLAADGTKSSSVFEYNGSGDVTKATSTDGSYDIYIYDNGRKLTRIDFFQADKSMSNQFVVTMDDKRRITKIVSETWGAEATYEYNHAGGKLSKIVVKADGVIFDQTDVIAYETDPTKKHYELHFKGLAFNPSLPTNDMLLYAPLNYKPYSDLWTASKFSDEVDDDGNPTGKLEVYAENEVTYTYNTNNYLNGLTIKNKLSPDIVKQVINYTNCK